MLKTFVALTTSAVLSTFSNYAEAEELNLTTELTKALFAEKQTIPFPQISGATCKQDGTAEGNPFLSLFSCVYYFKNVRGISGDVSYSEVKKPAIPDTIVSKPFFYKNCTATPYPVTDTISVTTTEGTSITTSTQITEGSSSTLTSSLTIPIKAVQLGLTDTKNITYGKSTNESSANNFTTSTTVTQQLNVSIDPMTSREIRLQKTLSTGYIDFDGIVAFESDVFMTIRNKGDGSLSNVAQIGTLSGFTPNSSERTLHLKGQIWNVKGEEVKRTDKVTTLVEDPDLCSSAEKSTRPMAFPITRSEGAKDERLRTDTKPIAGGASGGILTTVPVINGMQIETADAVATVNVRAKGMGPGFCSVTVSGGGSSATLSAPPLIWSNWQPLFSHIGKVSALITDSVDCDTGALFEIQYYK